MPVRPPELGKAPRIAGLPPDHPPHPGLEAKKNGA